LVILNCEAHLDYALQTLAALLLFVLLRGHQLITSRTTD
jgi:hypothetical protein